MNVKMEEHSNTADGSYHDPDDELKHSCALTNAIRSQLYNEETSDVILIIENERLYVHKLVLAARSSYFKALFYGGMKESKQSEIELAETRAEPFKLLLEFAYSSQIQVEKLKEDLLVEILELSRRYDFEDLENGICKHLKNILSVTNICVIMDQVIVYQISALMDDCLSFADKNAKEILKEKSFLSLSLATMNKILVRDSFFADEIDIFRAVWKWIELKNLKNAKDVFIHIRLPLIDVVNLVEEVMSTNLIPQTFLLSAIKAQVSAQTKYREMRYRGFIIADENLATEKFGAKVIEGANPESLLDGDYFTRKTYSWHDIYDKNGIVVDLGKPYLINIMRMLLYDKGEWLYSYYIEVSMDLKKWFNVADYRNKLCKSWQTIVISPKFARYVRIVGVNVVNNKKKFLAVHFECKFIPSEDCSKI